MIEQSRQYSNIVLISPDDPFYGDPGGLRAIITSIEYRTEKTPLLIMYIIRPTGPPGPPYLFYLLPCALRRRLNQT